MAKNVQLKGLQGSEIWYPETSIEQVQGLNNRLTGIDTSITNGLAEVREYVDGVKTLILGEGEIEEAFDTLKEVSDWIVGHQGDGADSISQLFSDVNNISDAINGDHGILERLDGHDTELSGHQTTLVGHQTTLGTLNADVSKAKTDISSLEGRTSKVEGDITSLTGEIGTIKGNITSIDSTLDTLDGKLTALTGRVSAAEGTLTTATNDISTLKTDLGTLSNAVNEIKNVLNGDQGLIAKVSDIATRLKTLEDAPKSNVMAVGVDIDE